MMGQQRGLNKIILEEPVVGQAKSVPSVETHEDRYNKILQENARLRMALEIIMNMSVSSNSLTNAITCARIALIKDVE